MGSYTWTIWSSGSGGCLYTYNSGAAFKATWNNSGDFLARVPGGQRQQSFPSTVAYVARLIVHRYAMLGVLDERGYPVSEMGVLEIPEDDRVEARGQTPFRPLRGKRCAECGNAAVIHKDGCEFCTACGAIGACG